MALTMTLTITPRVWPDSEVDLGIVDIEEGYTTANGVGFATVRVEVRDETGNPAPDGTEIWLESLSSSEEANNTGEWSSSYATDSPTFTNSPLDSAYVRQIKTATRDGTGIVEAELRSWQDGETQGVTETSNTVEARVLLMQAGNVSLSQGTPPVKFGRVHLTEHFAIVYVLSGNDKVSSATNITFLADKLEAAWRYYRQNPPTTPGFQPYNDLLYTKSGKTETGADYSSKYYVVVQHSSRFVPGGFNKPFTGQARPNTMDTATTADSFIVVAADATFRPNWQLEFEYLAAHELFHAFQFRHEAHKIGANIYCQNFWWTEATAEWQVRQVFSTNPGYLTKLGAFFSTPQTSLDIPRDSNPTQAQLGHAYGDVIFAKFLAENEVWLAEQLTQRTTNPSVIRNIWGRARPPDLQTPAEHIALRAVREDLNARRGGERLRFAFSEFAVCNLVKNPVDFPNSRYAYLEGNLFPPAATVPYTKQGTPPPGTKIPVDDNTLDHLAARYYNILPPSGNSGSLYVEFSGTKPVGSVQANDTWEVRLVGRKATSSVQDPNPDGGRIESWVEGAGPPPYYMGSGTILDFGQTGRYRQVVIVPCNVTYFGSPNVGEKNALRYALHVKFDPQ